MWECYLPAFTDPSDVCVAIYVKIKFSCTFAITNVLSHSLCTPESMILDISFDQELLRIVNIYHCTPAARDGHNLLHLFLSTLDPLIPTLLMGDLNTHSHIWSLPTATISPWATDLVNWFDDQGFELLNPPRIATWRSHQDRTHPSVLDLALINKAAAISGQISPLTISFTDSIMSDHAALSLFWYPVEAIAIAPLQSSPDTKLMMSSSNNGQSSSPTSPPRQSHSQTLTRSAMLLPNYTRTSMPPAPQFSQRGNILTPTAFVGGTQTVPLHSPPSTQHKGTHGKRLSAHSDALLLIPSINGPTTSSTTQPQRTSGKRPRGGRVDQSSASPHSSPHMPPSHMTQRR